MIFIARPSVSPYLTKTLFELQIPTVLTEEMSLPLRPSLKMMPLADIRKNPRLAYRSPILTSSENALNVLYNTIPNDERVLKSRIFKDKSLFRSAIAQEFPDFQFHEKSLDALSEVNPNALRYPLILKPATGICSIGVVRVDDASQWSAAVQFIKEDLQKYSANYTNSVVETNKVIIEDYVEGVELAIDGYFNSQSEPIILNILQHYFSHDHDTSDRIYFTRRSMVRRFLPRVQQFLERFALVFDLKRFPFHLEVRCTPEGRIVPIELNPLRFAGLGTTELAEYSYGINVYRHFFMETTPDWQSILSNEDDSIFAFFCADVPTDIYRTPNLKIQDRKLAREFSELLEYRILDEGETSTFAVAFFRTENETEIQHLMNLDLGQFMDLSAVK